jgi:hypothetical protein
MDAVSALTTRLIDYAGLFPPAELGMRQVVEGYSSYRAGEDAASLGRLIIPVDRLDEFEIASEETNKSGKESSPWRISALLSGDLKSAGSRVAEFNRRHSVDEGDGRFVIDAVELKVASPKDVAGACANLPQGVEVYVEHPLDARLDDFLAAIIKADTAAKIRTGGVTAAAFPGTSEVVRFLRACRAARVPFKATAGLHHPLRDEYPLTYRPDSAKARMFGFLNLFIAAAFIWKGADESSVSSILEESDATAFAFSNGTISWRQEKLTTEEIADARESFARSFGSCSFREPVDELKLVVSGATAA